MIAALGIIVLLLLAITCSEDRRAIAWTTAGRTFLLQLAIGIVAVATPVGVVALGALSGAVNGLLGFAGHGIGFVFGGLADPKATGLILAFQVLPVIIFVASLFAVLFHLRIMPLVIRGLGGAVRAITGVTRIEAMTSAACVFVGSVEAPLAVLPYLPRLSRTQLFVLMAGGLSSVSGTVLVAYAALGVRTDLLLTAAFMSAPGGLLMGRLLVPERETPFDVSDIAAADAHHRASGLIDAATEGALVGMRIMLNVIAVLVAFVALIALVDGALGGFGRWIGVPGLSLEAAMGYVFAPLAWLIGVPWDEALRAAPFLGQKTVLNEFLAYAGFAPVMAQFSPVGQMAVTIALCGFANLSGLAILIASLGAAVPERRSEVSGFGMRAMLAGTLSNLMSAAIVTLIATIAGRV